MLTQQTQQKSVHGSRTDSRAQGRNFMVPGQWTPQTLVHSSWTDSGHQRSQFMAAEQTVDPKEVSSWQLNRQWTPEKLFQGSLSNFNHSVKYCTCITTLIAKSPNMHLGLIIIAIHNMQILTFTLIYLQLDRTKAWRLQSSSMWKHAIWESCTNVSEEPATSIININLLYPDEGSSSLLWNIYRLLLDYTPTHHRSPLSS